MFTCFYVHTTILSTMHHRRGRRMMFNKLDLKHESENISDLTFLVAKSTLSQSLYA